MIALGTIDFESIKILYCTELGTARRNRRKRSRQRAGFAENPVIRATSRTIPPPFRNVLEAFQTSPSRPAHARAMMI
jgi:hypothetical protein